jgi:Rhamnogalacturonate lyase family
MGNGIIQVTFLKPQGRIIGIKYNGIDNLLDYAHKESNLGGYAQLISTHILYEIQNHVLLFSKISFYFV